MFPGPPSSRPVVSRTLARAVAGATFLALLLALGGCSTKRTLRIESDPAGAEVWVNSRKLPGTTPLDVPFIHYQTFEVRIEKPGHLPFAGPVQVSGGIDGYPVVDLPSELTRRQRGFVRRFKLDPLPERPDKAGVDAILDEARAFRDEAQREAARGTSARPETQEPRGGNAPPPGSER